MDVARLGDLVEVLSGLPKGRIADGDGDERSPTLLVSIRCLTSAGLVLPSDDEQLHVDLDARGIRNKLLRANDLLVSLRGTTFRVARVDASILRRAKGLAVVPDSNIGVLRPVRDHGARSGPEARQLSNLLLSWLSSPRTEVRLVRSRAPSGAFLVRIADLRTLELPPGLTRLGRESSVEARRIRLAADLIERAERSYRASLEIANIRRDLAHRVTRDLLDDGSAG